jgi:hypothetical protein
MGCGNMVTTEGKYAVWFVATSIAADLVSAVIFFGLRLLAPLGIAALCVYWLSRPRAA